MISQFFDRDYIVSLITDPRIWPSVSDDYIEVGDYEPNADLAYLLITDSGESAGFFIIHKFNSVASQVHTVVDPRFWGKSSIYTKELVDWFFSQNDDEKLITFIPEDNDKARRLAEKTGMKKEGELTSSIKKGGVLYSQYIYSINRGDLCRQQQ